MAHPEDWSSEQLLAKVTPDGTIADQANLEVCGYDWWPATGKWRLQGRRSYGAQAGLEFGRRPCEAPNPAAEIARFRQVVYGE